MSEELRYKWADISVESYERDLDELWSELQNPNSALSREAADLGLNVEELRQVERKEAIGVRVEGEGFGGETVALIIALAPVATATIKALTPIIHDVWKHILFPRILQRKGGQALVPKE
ncbi:MAG TPA: hypothetical protein VNA19_02510 [Pyrinomonadaceae bacterium]|jgi:hypothetical protein|nr:hypothetical protein [Pyrinomonadaceae bacterium]